MENAPEYYYIKHARSSLVIEEEGAPKFFNSRLEALEYIARKNDVEDWQIKQFSFHPRRGDQ
jgi:hypothetical protein